MKIETKTFKIKKIQHVSSKYIENFFEDKNIEPVRWSINKVDDKHFIVDAAIYVKDKN